MGRHGGTTTGMHSPRAATVEMGKKPGLQRMQKQVQAHQGGGGGGRGILSIRRRSIEVRRALVPAARHAPCPREGFKIGVL